MKEDVASLKEQLAHFIEAWSKEEFRSISAELALQSGDQARIDRHFAKYGGPGHSTMVRLKTEARA